MPKKADKRKLDTETIKYNWYKWKKSNKNKAKRKPKYNDPFENWKALNMRRVEESSKKRKSKCK